MRWRCAASAATSIRGSRLAIARQLAKLAIQYQVKAAYVAKFVRFAEVARGAPDPG